MSARCLRCDGPLSQLDVEEGLCASSDCFIVFLRTLQTLGLDLPPLYLLTQAWWAEAYLLVAKEGRRQLPPVGSDP